jgi:hypothetical protein
LYSYGAENLPGDLTDVFAEVTPTEKRRGPHTELTDDQLFGRREQLVQVFEGLWGEIGWKLQKCKTPADLVRILSPLNETFIREMVSVFFHESSEPVSAATARKVRAKWRAGLTPCREAEASKHQVREELKRVDAVLTNSPRNKQRMIKREQKRCRKEASRTTQKWRWLSKTTTALEVQLRGLESGLARQEILRFCKSGRYELTPLNLANAVAGLPYMGWRQSMRRTSNQPSMVANGLDYNVFKAIRFIVTNANKQSENNLVAEYRHSIPLLPSRYRGPRVELADKWFFVERAIRRAFRSSPHPKALPFEITKHYFKQFRSQSHVELILAKQAKLPLTKARRVSISIKV